MEVFVDGWDIEKTVTIDFKTPDIGLGPHACQNVRVVGFTETTITFSLIQQPWICCESFGCAIRGERPSQLSFSCGLLQSPPPSPPPSPHPPPPPSPPMPRPPPPPSPPPPPLLHAPPTPPPPPIIRVGENGVLQGSEAPSGGGHAHAHGKVQSDFAGKSSILPVEAAEPRVVIMIGVIVVLVLTLYQARSLGLLRVLQRLILERRGVQAVPIMAAAEARATGFKPRARPKVATVRIVRGGKKLADVELSLKGLSNIVDFEEALAAALADELEVTDAFKIHYMDSSGDLVMVNEHTDLKELACSSSVTAKLDAPKKGKNSKGSGSSINESDSGKDSGREGKGKKSKSSGHTRRGSSRSAPPPLAMANDMSD